MSGQVLADSSNASTETSLAFVATATLDGTSTSFVLNFIDGTQMLNFIPRAVTTDVVGGTQSAAAVLSTVTDAPTTNLSTMVRLSGAGTAGNTLKIAGFVLK